MGRLIHVVFNGKYNFLPKQHALSPSSSPPFPGCAGICLDLGSQSPDISAITGCAGQKVRGSWTTGINGSTMKYPSKWTYVQICRSPTHLLCQVYLQLMKSQN